VRPRAGLDATEKSRLHLVGIEPRFIVCSNIYCVKDNPSLYYIVSRDMTSFTQKYIKARKRASTLLALALVMLAVTAARCVQITGLVA
jgi:hypothetical protein